MRYATQSRLLVHDLAQRFRRFATETTDQRYIDMFLRAASDIEIAQADRKDVAMRAHEFSYFR